jgi:hypothetical protein
VIYRLGRKPDPWSVPDWASAGPDGTFGNRFDDPEGMYRALYASSQRLGCFLETLGRFRVDPKLLAELAEIEGEDDYTGQWNAYFGMRIGTPFVVTSLPDLTNICLSGSFPRW